MAIFEKGADMGAARCPACGNPVKLAADKNGKACGFCYSLSTKGNPCGTRFYFGRDPSEERSAEILEKRKQKTTAKQGVKTDGQRPQPTGNEDPLSEYR